MATTRYSQNVVGGLPKTSRFGVTANGDEVLSGGQYLVLGAYFEGAATGLSLDGGTTPETEYPFQVAADETVSVVATGDGDVTIVFSELPSSNYTTYTT